MELEACPPNHQGWEWQYLTERFRSTFTSIPGSGPPIFAGDENWLIAIGTVRKKDHCAQIWELTSEVQYPIGELRHDRPLTFLALSPDETRLAAGDDRGGVVVWDVKTGWSMETAKTTLSVEGNGKKIDGMAFSPDGRWIATVSWPNILNVYDTDSGRRRFPPKHFPQPHPKVPSHLRKVVFSPDGHWIATAFHRVKAMLVDASSGKIAHEFPGEGHMLPTFSPVGKLIATGNVDGSITLWNWDGMESSKVRELTTADSSVWALEFSADGTKLVSAHRRSSVKLWDVDTGNELAAFLSRDYARWLAINRTSKQIAFNTVAAQTAVKESSSCGLSRHPFTQRQENTRRLVVHPSEMCRRAD